MQALRASIGVRKLAGWPARKISPESTVRAPVNAFTRVDLPAPLSPMMASTSPGYRSRSTPSRPTTRPKVLIRPRALSTGSRVSTAAVEKCLTGELMSDLDLSDPLIDGHGDNDQDTGGQHPPLIVHAGKGESAAEHPDDQRTQN